MENEEIIILNKQLIGRIKDMRLYLKKFKNGNGEELTHIINKTKVYILGLGLDKKDENFRNGVINMIDEYRTKISSRDHEENIDLKYRLLNIVEGFIEVMELREENSEEDSGEEEKAEAEESETTEEGKKSKTNKEKSE